MLSYFSFDTGFLVQRNSKSEYIHGESDYSVVIIQNQR